MIAIKVVRMTRTYLRHTMSAVAALALVSAFASSTASQGLSLGQFQTIELGLLIEVGSKPKGQKGTNAPPSEKIMSLRTG